MKSLFTGFKGYNNPSNVVIGKIIDKTNMDTLLFNNSYEQIDRQLGKINLNGYDLIIMLGLRNNLKKSIRIEVNAYLDNELLTTNINYDELGKYFIDNEVNCLINNKSINYLCNYAYHKVLKRNKNTIFLHLLKFCYIGNINRLIDLFSNVNIAIT